MQVYITPFKSWMGTGGPWGPVVDAFYVDGGRS
jgi:hypothetical protein